MLALLSPILPPVVAKAGDDDISGPTGFIAMEVWACGNRRLAVTRTTLLCSPMYPAESDPQ